MKVCPSCGLTNEDQAAACWKCNQSMTGALSDAEAYGVAGAPGAAAGPTLRPRTRPDGSGILLAGWIMFGLSLAFLLLALSADTDRYGLPDFGAIARQWWLLVSSATLFELFLVFWAVGTIVQALSFLPGKGDGN